MRFLRLCLENWRNFTRADVLLQQRVFIAGPNASGKSNLLDALRFLQDIAAVGGGLQNAVEGRMGLSRIRCLAARRYPDIVFTVELGEDFECPEWTYEIAFGQHTAPKKTSRAVVKRETVRRRGELLLSRPDDEDNKDPERLTETHLERVSANREFRDIAEFLASVRYLHVVPHLVRDPDLSASRKRKDRDPFGTDFLEQIARTASKTQHSRLNRIERALRVALPQLQHLQLVRDNLGKPHLRGKYEHWRPQGAWQQEEQFSDGTLRLMGLLWAVLDGTGPLLLEEPELSLHPAVVRFIPQMLWRATRNTRRQLFVSTHSSDLLSDRGIAPDEVLLLYPDPEGTRIVTGAKDREIKRLLQSGLSVADAVFPAIAPKRPEQLLLFPEGSR
jgi:predicted ATPase